jgi:hypothetical protein
VGLPSLAAQEQGLRVILARRLSVRQTEGWVASYSEAASRRRRLAPELLQLAADLEEKLGLPVTVSGRIGRGRVAIRFTSREQLARLRDRLSV